MRIRAAAITLALLAACEEPLSPRIPADVVPVSGHDQTGAVGAELDDPVLVRVVDLNGTAVPGVPVDFAVVKGGGNVIAGAAVSNSDGLAQDRWILDQTVADSQVVEARVLDSTGAIVAITRIVATAHADAPDTISIVAGNGQTALTGSQFGDSLLVRVADRFGNPVSNATVTFSLPANAGSLSVTSAQTSATGHASTKWTAGSVAGVFAVGAAVSGVAPSTFSATITDYSGPVPLLEKTAGDGGTVAPGSTVAVAPSVRVRDAQGNPVSGVTVVFQVTAGGGSVTGATPKTDASGNASVGSWTVGTAKGENLLRATVGGASVTFSKTAGFASPLVSVQFVNPKHGFVVEEAVSLELQVSSTHALAGAPQVSMRNVTVTTQPSSGRWVAQLSLADIPHDTVTLIATATDVQGNTSDVFATVNLDRRPQVTLRSPIHLSVTPASVTVEGECVDDKPGCTVTIVVENNDHGSASTGTVSQSVSLAAYAGRSILLGLRARDSQGRQTQRLARVYVAPGARYTELTSGPAASLAVDHSGSRLLFLEQNVTHHTTIPKWHPSIRDGGGTTRLVDTAQTTQAEADGRADARLIGFLTPVGAMWEANAASLTLFDWRQGVRQSRAPAAARGAGNYAIINEAGTGTSTLLRTDASTPTFNASTIATGSICETPAIATNGDAVFGLGSPTSCQIQRSRGGEITLVATITTGQPATPRTDGTRVIYATSTALKSYENGVTTDVGPATIGHDVNNGWIAYLTDATGTLTSTKVWRRSPAGTAELLIDAGTSCRLESIGSDGSVVFWCGANANSRTRYLAPAGGAAAAVGAAMGTVLWRDGRHIVLIGRSVFTIAP